MRMLHLQIAAVDSEMRAAVVWPGKLPKRVWRHGKTPWAGNYFAFNTLLNREFASISVPCQAASRLPFTTSEQP
jgi:hypothetical protein